MNLEIAKKHAKVGHSTVTSSGLVSTTACLTVNVNFVENIRTMRVLVKVMRAVFKIVKANN